MAEVKHLTQVHYAQVVAVLRALDVQARVVSGEAWMGLEVRRGDDRIYWGNSESRPVLVTLPWGWTVVDKASGKIESGRTHIAPDASPEDVALAIALVYAEPEDGPTL